jgi:4-diphosphocytidyl-2-C-methyl-D-erythritol kinase
MHESRLTLRAPAKINLYLKVLGRRHDGYHLLATLMQKVALYDEIEMKRVAGRIVLECPDSSLPVDDANIMIKAAKLFFGRFSKRLPAEPGISMVLHKNIPVAAGLGGGSSDAATVLCGLNMIYKTGCSEEELAALGVSIGADVPFFVYNQSAAWASGIGEELSPAPGLDSGSILLVNPGFPVSTRWVYEKLSLTIGENIYSLLSSRSLSKIKEMECFCQKYHFRPTDVDNDLETVTLRDFKELEDIKENLVLSGAISALMSGSGPTVFGIFTENDRLRAEQCLVTMKELYKRVFLITPLAGEILCKYSDSTPSSSILAGSSSTSTLSRPE